MTFLPKIFRWLGITKISFLVGQRCSNYQLNSYQFQFNLFIVQLIEILISYFFSQNFPSAYRIEILILFCYNFEFRLKNTFSWFFRLRWFSYFTLVKGEGQIIGQLKIGCQKLYTCQKCTSDKFLWSIYIILKLWMQLKDNSYLIISLLHKTISKNTTLLKFQKKTLKF